MPDETSAPTIPVSEAARRKECSTQTIYNALERGDLNEVNFPGSSTRLVAIDDTFRAWGPAETGRRVG